MARYRVRNKENNDWLDVSEYDMMVRTHDNNWLQLLPDQFSVRNVWGRRWHNIDDQFDPEYDDPCDFIETGECSGGPTSQTKGSGNGEGSHGPAYDTLLGYPAGYDLPDAGRSGFGIRINNMPPTGRAIRRPGIKTVESYDPVGSASLYGLGTYANPNVPYASVSGRGAAITETIYALPATNGYVELLFACYSKGGISVDVYHLGLRVASTCGRVTGRSRIKFELDPTADDLRIMIRVRGEGGCNWSLQVLPPKLVASPDRGNLALDHQMLYDVINFPDVIHPEYIGSPIFPAPCHATVWPIMDRLNDSQAFEYYHYVGNTEGMMYLDYTSWDTFDFIEVYHGGKRIATTLDAQTNLGYLYFHYDSKGTDAGDLMVRVVAKDFGPAESLASFYYSMYCPDVRGAREYRHPCQSYWVTSAGHPTTEDQFLLTNHTDKRAILVEVDSGNFDTKFELFDEDMNLLDTEILNAQEQGTLECWKDPSVAGHDRRSKVTVRATSAIGCDWTYLVYCPVQPPKMNVPDYVVPYRCIEYGQGTSGDGDDRPGHREPWEVTKSSLRFWGNVDHTVRLNFKVATPAGKRYTGSGKGSVLTPAVAAIGGYFEKTNEGWHGDLHSNIDYNSWMTVLNGRALSEIKFSFKWSGSVQSASVVQTPTAANGWIGIIDVFTPASGEQYVDLSMTTTAIYR